MNASEIVIHYATNAEKLPAWAEDILRGWMADAQVAYVMVSSSWRFPADQARIMYDLIQKNGVSYALNLYGAQGDKVINAYSATMPRDLVLAVMTKVIVDIGPEKISNHMNAARVTFDLAPSSMTAAAGTRLRNVLKAAKSAGAVVELEYPPEDPAFHVAIPVNGRGSWPPSRGNVGAAVVITAAILFAGAKWLGLIKT